MEQSFAHLVDESNGVVSGQTRALTVISLATGSRFDRVVVGGSARQLQRRGFMGKTV